MVGEYTPSKLYWHEALDRSSLACDFFSENVEKHPAIENDPDLKAKAARITELMSELYQHVGRKHYMFDNFYNKPGNKP